MPANVLRGIVRSAVEGYLPVGALDVAREAEESERKGLHFLANAIEQAEKEGIL